MESEVERVPGSSGDDVTRLRDALSELRGMLALPGMWADGAAPSTLGNVLDTLSAIAGSLGGGLPGTARELDRAEAAVRDSERSVRLVIDNIPGLVALLTAAGEVEFVNHQILDYTGQTLEELRHWGTNGTVHGDDLPHVADVFMRSIRQGTRYEIVQRLRRYDGAYRWFENSGFPLRDDGGRVVRWCVLLTDIDERKRAEEALAASEQRLKLIIDTIPALVWSCRPDGRAGFFNRHYLEFIGLSAEDADGWGWTAAVHPEDAAAFAETWRRVLASEAPGEAEVRLRRHDGVYRWFLFRAHPLCDTAGRIVDWYGINTDIEDRKQAEVELKRAYDSFRDAQRLSHTGSFTADIVADEHVWSEELYRICEFEPGTRISTNWAREIIHPDDVAAFDAGFSRSLEGADFDLTFRIITRSGRLKHLHSIARMVDQAGGRPLFVGAIQDVTDARVAEEALNRARSDLAHVARATTLSTLTASIAHEVNQPLSGIMTNAATCLRMLDASPPNVDGARETARRTIRDGNRASEVILRLRAMFTRREPVLESLDLNDAVREVIALSMSDLQRNRVLVESSLDDALPCVSGDRVQLQQVVLNLVRNASEAMLPIHDRPRRLTITTAREPGDRVRVVVQDTGVGVDPGSLEKLFETFYTTKAEGMGIGLSLSRSIIERHHGRLWAESNDGPGAAFVFSIPCEAG